MSSDPQHQASSASPPAPPPAPSRRRTWWIVAAVLLLLAAGGYATLGKAQPAAEKKGRPGGGLPVPVVAVPAQVSDVDLYIAGLGTVTPLNTVTVRSRVDGHLMEVYFQEGQDVKKGEPLAKIDPRPFEVQLTQAQGQMAKDQALLQNARLDLKRFKELAAQDLIPRQQLDTQEALVRQYEGVVKADQGQIDNARLQITYCHITAPVEGRVGLRLVDPGNMVRASDQGGLLVIAQVRPIAVVFTIAEDSLTQVLEKYRSGGKLPVEAWDREQQRKLAQGHLLTMDNQIDTSTGTVKLKALLPNQGGELFPNQFVNARLLVETLRGAIVVPAAAIQRGPQGVYVFVVKEDQTAAMRKVNLGQTQEGRTVVASGLAPGELVVIDGAERLREGAKVEAKERGNGPAAPKAP
ncbi:MAG: MdtA/MuxA family multidrug efflux RND transporter periplasmic adaptor subunit [Desulfarculus sp.]|nr:MdtA/MuxA family multidrug efflux RND transporter periplasmic adaptor subunit [Desulfarculus sp.]